MVIDTFLRVGYIPLLCYPTYIDIIMTLFGIFLWNQCPSSRDPIVHLFSVSVPAHLLSPIFLPLLSSYLFFIFYFFFFFFVVVTLLVMVRGPSTLLRATPGTRGAANMSFYWPFRLFEPHITYIRPRCSWSSMFSYRHHTRHTALNMKS